MNISTSAVRGALLLAAFLAWPARSSAQNIPAFRPITPLEPIAAILDAFKTHDVVALSDAHGNLQNHAFRLSLIRDPRFADVVDDIVIELGNSRYQDLADRFVSGTDVPLALLRKVWDDTTGVTAGNN